MTIAGDEDDELSGVGEEYGASLPAGAADDAVSLAVTDETDEDDELSAGSEEDNACSSVDMETLPDEISAV